jgi:hypothetical protein
MTEVTKVISVSHEQVISRLRAAAAYLTDAEGSLRDSLLAGLDYQLDLEAAAAFETLRDFGFLAGLAPLPCCATHGAPVDAFVADLQHLLAAHE